MQGAKNDETKCKLLSSALSFSGVEFGENRKVIKGKGAKRESGSVY